jgi:hypothetical protein
MAESPPAAPARIFISYRREETAYAAGWLFDRLADEFGGGQVFKDVDSIELGDDFSEVISNAVGSTDVLLALIGDQWLTITDERGTPRLNDPDDFVRLEIEAALARGVRVIPILVDGARMPRDEELPPSLAPLARRQALELSPSRFDFDTSRLLKVLDKTLAEGRRAKDDAASALAMQAPGSSKLDVEQLEDASRGRTRSVPPVAPAAPDWRRRFSARPRILIGIGVGIAAVLVALAIPAIIAKSNNAPSPTAADKGTETTPASTGPDTPIFRDDFSSNVSGWEDVGAKQTGGHFANQAYRIYAKPVPGGRSDWHLPQTSSVYPKAPPNIRIDVEARRIGGSDADAGYGIACRADVNGNAYTFTLSATGNYVSIAKFLDGDWSPMDDGQTSGVDENASLRAVCTGGEGQQTVHLEFFVDGELVAEATDPKNPLATGSVGLLVATGEATKHPIEAEFDDFVVTRG